MTYPAQAAAAPAAATLDQTPAFDDSTMTVRAPRAAAEGEGAQEAAATAVAQARAVPSVTTTAVAASALQLASGPPVHSGPGPSGGDEGSTGPRGRMRRLRIGSHLASSAALIRLSPAGPAAGLLLGLDHQRRPVGVRLFRPEPTRVLIVGGTWAAQLLVFRAFALGARVVVASDHEQEWLSFGRHATGRSDRLLAVPPESIASGATARTPTLIVDDRREAAAATQPPLGPWQTHVTVLSELDLAGARAAQRCDLAILQRLSSDEAGFAAQLLRLPAQSIASLQGTPDDVLALVADGTDRYVNVAQTALERSHIGAPNPRPLPPPRTLVAPPPPRPEPAAPPVPVTLPVPPQPVSVPTPVTIPTPVPPPASVPPPPPVPPTPPVPTPLVPAPPPAEAPPGTSTVPPSPAAWTPPPQAPATWTAPPQAPAGWSAPPSPVVDPGVALARPGAVPAPAPVVEPVAAPETPGRRRRPIMIGVGAIAVLTLAGWIAGFLVTGNTPAPAPTTRPPATPTPQEVIRPLAVPTITAVAEGDGIRFTWTYDEPADGDFFRVQRTDVNDPQAERLDEPEFFVADDEACLQVTIFRRNGQGGPPEVKCYP